MQSCPEAEVIAVTILYIRTFGLTIKNLQTLGKSPEKKSPSVVIQIAETLTPSII